MMELPPRTRLAARRLRLLALLFTALFELIVLFAAWVLVAGDRADFPALRIEDSGLAPWPAAAAVLLMGGCIGVALLRLARMLGKIAAGAPFSASADLRAFALWLFLGLLAMTVLPPLLALALGASRADFNFGGAELLMLVVTGLLFLVARLLDEAQRLAEDHEQIV